MGAVLGISEGEQEASYAVAIDDEEHLWMFDEGDLTSTGTYRRAEHYESGVSIRVSERGKVLGER